MKKLLCPVNNEECPLLDYGGHFWCNGDMTPEDFEICPIPKKRIEAIKEDAVSCIDKIKNAVNKN